MSEDPDEMQHYAAFHLGLHFLQKYSFRGFPEYKGLSLLVKLWYFYHRVVSLSILPCALTDYNSMSQFMRF